MNGRRRAYTSTVTSPGSTAVGLILTVAVGVFLYLVLGRPLVAVSGAAVVALCGVYVSTVRLVVGADHLVVGQGPWAWPARRINFDDIVGVGTDDLALGQVVGVGLGSVRNLTRLTVRVGPSLDLVLRSGEHLVISTPRPDQAVPLITGAPPDRTATSTTTQEAPMREPPSDPRPWFGPKRVGYGIGPRTWQGWAIVLAAVIVVVALIRVV